MRVVIFAESLGGPGGIQRSTLFVAQHLARNGHRVALIHGEEGDLSPSWRTITSARLPLGSVQLPRRSPASSLRRCISAWRFVASEKPDILYCHSMNQLPLANFVGRKSGIPVVLHLRTAPPIPSDRNRRRLREPAAFIAVSESTRSAWLPLRPDLNSVCEVVPNGVDLATFAPVEKSQRDDLRRALGVPVDARVVVFVGRFSPEKGSTLR